MSMWSDIAYYATLAFESAIGIFGVRLYEEPRYEVLTRLGERLEIRRYAPRLAAEVVLPRAGRAETDDAFRLLFAYIAGANQDGETRAAKLAMTVPVEVRGNDKLAMTAPVQVSEADGAVRMLFYLPKKYSADSAPKPTDERVQLVSVPSETIAALRYSGPSDNFGLRRSELMNLLKESLWRPTGTPYQLSYDPPFTLPFLRRNEAAVAVDQRP